MRRRCRLRETGWAEFGYFLGYFKMVAPRALDFRPLVKENEALETRLRLRETGWAEFGYFLRYFEMAAPRALVFRPLVKGNEALGTRLRWMDAWKSNARAHFQPFDVRRHC